MSASSHETILILDYGSQFTQLIARRIREQNVFCEILPYDTPVAELRNRAPRGIVLSGGPQSVETPGAPALDATLLDSGTPLLGICYGSQLLAKTLGGEVRACGRREYGHADLEVLDGSTLMRGLDGVEPVWMSHADDIRRAPDGFRVTGRSAGGGIAAFESPARGLYGIHFHPEVAHTPRGALIIRNFLFEICGCRGDWTLSAFIAEAVAEIRGLVGETGRVLLGLSGGVDSAVAALLIHRAIGDRLVPLFIDTGLLRKGEAEDLQENFPGRFEVPVLHRDAGTLFLEALAGVADPERKRKITGETFARVFEEEASRLGRIEFFGQGTLYPDRIESAAVKGPSATIKTHHNVGGLPARMSMKLVEPLRDLFKDEVRRLGRELGLAEEMISRHPFPGPGLAVRILGEVTADDLALLREADAIFIEEIRKSGLYGRTAQAFAVLLPVRSVGVMGDARTYERVLALRSVDSADFMTAEWSRLPYDLLARASNRIINEVHGINRVVYDVSSKPPSTIEWE